jgi:hypothetical protein
VDILGIPELDGDVLKLIGDGVIGATIQQDTALPVVAQDQPLDLPAHPQHHGIPGTAFQWLALDLDGLILARRSPRGLAVEARRSPVEVTGLFRGDVGHGPPSRTIQAVCLRNKPNGSLTFHGSSGIHYVQEV